MIGKRKLGGGRGRLEGCLRVAMLVGAARATAKPAEIDSLGEAIAGLLLPHDEARLA